MLSADQVQRVAAAGAGLALDIEPDILAWQMRRQARPLHLWFGGYGLDGRKPGFGSRQFDFEVLEAEVQLVIIEPFRPPAELAALQLLDDEMQPFDLSPRLAEVGPLGRERAHHPPQRLHIIRQGRKINVHDD
jgi:hypothetical protein